MDKAARFDAWTRRWIMPVVMPLLWPATIVGAVAILSALAFGRDMRGSLVAAGLIVGAAPHVVAVVCAATYATLSVRGRRSDDD